MSHSNQIDFQPVSRQGLIVAMHEIMRLLRADQIPEAHDLALEIAVELNVDLALAQRLDDPHAIAH